MQETTQVKLKCINILRRLGTDGMSVICLARRDDTQELVVLKVIQIDPQRYR